MLISTSINISVSRKKRLALAARTLDVTVTELLSALMARSRLHYGQFAARIRESVDYQPDAIIEGEEYIITHVRLDPICYEYGVSERLVFKVSVSFIYRVVIDLFLDDLVKNGTNKPVSDLDLSTNYNDLDYVVYYKGTKSHEFWTVKWDRRVKIRELMGKTDKHIVFDTRK